MSEELVKEYWRECIATAAKEARVSLTPVQIDIIASAAEAYHDNYESEFYGPPLD